MDPITLEVIGSALLSITENMGQTLIRSAFSPNIKERRDCSTALFDAQGRVIAQAEHIPIHLGSLLGVVQAVRDRFGNAIEPGDVFMANDPYSGGGTHLPDVTVVTPIFHGEELVAFAANLAHHYDIGGAVPGGIAGNTETIYAEGLRLPPVRLQRGGAWSRDVLDIFLLNCRDPEMRRLDLEGQLAANRVGAQRVSALVETYGLAVLTGAMDALLDYGERKLRAAAAQVPDGEFSFVTYLDDDGVGTQDIPIAVKLSISGDQLHLDFTGSGSQVKGAINVVPAALLATVYYAVKAALDPTIPANGGFHRALSVYAPPGSILNPRPPAAVGARTDTCQVVAGAVLAAFAQALPGRIPAGSNDASSAVVFSGVHPHSKKPFIYVEAVGGGAGARPQGDGLDGVQVHVTNTSNLPVESLENNYPLLIERYEFIDGSGGRGRYRGGMGLRRDVRCLADQVVFSSHGDRHRHRPWGLAGGGPGRPGAYILNPGQAGERRLPAKVSGVMLNQGDLLRIETPGGGGYGIPDDGNGDGSR